MTDTDATHAVVVLVEGDEEASTVAAIIRDLADPAALVLLPPRRGDGFFADTAIATEIDRWWADNVPRSAEPVYVLDFSPRLLSWIAGLDGHFIIRRGRQEIAADALTSVEVVDASSPLELAGHVLGHLAAAGLCSAEDARGLLAFANATQRSRSPSPTPEQPPKPPTPDLSSSTAVTPGPSLAPATSKHPPEASQRAVERPVSATNGRSRSFADLLRRTGLFASRSQRPDPPARDTRLAAAITRRTSTIVVVGSRHSGVRRTSHAAGIATVAGSALDGTGRRAAIVDCSAPNSTARGDIELPLGSGTVGDTIAALMAKRDPPRPVVATTAAMACYPDLAESSQHSRDEITLLASHLRTAFPFSVIDLGEGPPDSSAEPTTAVAASWLELADVVVLSTAWAKQDFTSVLDYLEAPEHPPAVVAYIAPRARRDREHPVTQRFLAAIALRAHAVVEIPDETYAMRYAGAAGIRVDPMSRRLRDAYQSLTRAVLRAAGSGGR